MKTFKLYQNENGIEVFNICQTCIQAETLEELSSVLSIKVSYHDNGFISPFYECNVAYTLTQAGNKDVVSIERD